MNKYNKIIFYYLSIITTLFIVLWIIWAKFLRVRLVKTIPMILSEYGFWFLCYLCIIYLVIIMMILISLYAKKPNKNNEKNIIKEMMNQIYKPFIMLDHAFKYNKYLEKNYNNFKISMINRIKNFKEKGFVTMILVFQLFPRIILVIVLFMDTFYFNKLELLYKVISLGFLPFMFRYIKYNFNDFKEYYIKVLQSKYKYIYLLDEASAEIKDWELNNDNKYHDQDISIKEYADFKIQQCLYGTPKVKYSETPIPHDKILSELSENDFDKIQKEFPQDITIICDSAVIYEKISHFQNKKVILYIRLFIYIFYFICWFYILTKSYYTYPLDLPMFKYFVKNLTYYIFVYDYDPFSMLHQISINENLVTPENIISLIKKLLYMIKNAIKNIIP